MRVLRGFLGVRADCWIGRACRSWNCVKVREWLSFPPSGDLDGEGKVLCWRGGWELLLWSPPELSVPQPLWWRVEKERWWGLCGVRLEDNAGDLVVSVLHQVFRQNGSKHRLPFRVLLIIYRQDSSLGAVECLWACQNWLARSFSSWHLRPGPSAKLLSYHCLQHITHRVQRIPVQWMND